MTWVAVAIGGSAILGGVLSSDASRRAANTQADAANNAQQTQLQMFNQIRSDLSPWTQAGGVANADLMNLLGVGGTPGSPTFNPNAPLVKPFSPSDLTTDPSYQWRLQQGENALLNNASRMGGLGGGNTMRALSDYAQGSASQEYQNAFNRYNVNQQNIYGRLAGLSNTGANAAGGQAGIGANVANNISGLQYAAGQANAGGILGQQNALTGAGNNLAWLLASQQQQGGGGSGGGLSGLLASLFGGGDAAGGGEGGAGVGGVGGGATLF